MSGPTAFGEQLRHLRKDAGLTIESLAARAGIAVRTVSDLELGNALSPRESTLSRLAWGLRLTGTERARFAATARGRPPAAGLPAPSGTTPPRTLPRDLASFTGRSREIGLLTGGAAPGSGELRVFAISGMAGVGKTALAVHAGHLMAAQFPDGQIFLRLDGHAPGQRPADPAEVLASALQTAGADPRQIPAGLEARARLWRHWMAGQRVLLLLDDAASSAQVRPLLPGTAGSLVLVTSRRNLTALDDIRAVDLDVLPPAEAASLFARLSGRPRLDPADPALAQIARLCGGLPLAVGILGRRLRHHVSWSPADLAVDLVQHRSRLDPLHGETVSVSAAFDSSYHDLTGDQQQLFRRLGLHPGADADAWAAAALSGIGPADAHRHLQALYDHNLITEPAPGRYRFHDLIREHARARSMAEDPPGEREAATARLLAYLQSTAAHAETLLTRHTRPRPASVLAVPATAARSLPDRAAALSWLRAERASLLAFLDAAAAARQEALVVSLTAALAASLRHDGPWTEAITRHAAAARAACQLGDRLGQAGALDDLGIVQRLSGSYGLAAAAHQQALALYCQLGSRLGQANALSHLGYARSLTDDYPEALRTMREALAIYRELGDEPGLVETLNHLGAVLRLTGDFSGAADALTQAIRLCRSSGNRQGEANALIHLGAVQLRTGDADDAAGSLRRALAICGDIGSQLSRANALSYLGTALRQLDDDKAAVRSYQDALGIYCSLGNRLGQANTLGDLGAVWRLAGDAGAAADALGMALAIYRDLGDQMGQATTLNEMGALQLAAGDLAEARACHVSALELARTIGSSWDEAQAQAGIGRCARSTGDPAGALSHLRRAQQIFQRLRAPEAAQVSAEIARLSRTT